MSNLKTALAKAFQLEESQVTDMQIARFLHQIMCVHPTHLDITNIQDRVLLGATLFEAGFKQLIGSDHLIPTLEELDNLLVTDSGGASDIVVGSYYLTKHYLMLKNLNGSIVAASSSTHSNSNVPRSFHSNKSDVNSEYISDNNTPATTPSKSPE